MEIWSTYYFLQSEVYAEMALKVRIFAEELSSLAFRKFVYFTEYEPIILYHQRMRLVKGEALSG